MQLAPDSRAALIAAAALVNTQRNGVELLFDVEALAAFYVEYEWTGRLDGTAEELEAVRALCSPLLELWDCSDVDGAAELVNRMLRTTRAQPRLARHGTTEWHLHVSSDTDPLADRMGAEAAMGVLDLIRSNDLDRLRPCASSVCDSVLVDLSRNKSKMYCDTGNCGNREHVAAYRARKSTTE